MEGLTKRRQPNGNLALVSLLIGIGATCIPSVWGWLSDGLGIYPMGLTVANIILMPGLAVALVVGGGNVHTFSLGVVLVSNAAIYAVIAYLALNRRRAKKPVL